jgi:large repetitive protein
MKILFSLVFIFFSLVVYSQIPVVNSFSPTLGGSGTTVNIKGLNFLGTTSVSFGGTPAASFVVDSATGIKAIVGSGSAGAVTVTNSFGASSLDGFISPSIVSFTPSTATLGTIVTIKGYNLSTTSSVSFGGTPATSFTILSDTAITAKVGKSSTGNISVTTTFGSYSKSGFSYIGPPTISSFSPTSGSVNTVVTIVGTGFNASSLNANIVYFGTVAAQITAITPTTITVISPTGTSFQPISVTSNSLIAFSKKSFNTTFVNNYNLLNNSSFAKHIIGYQSDKFAISDFNADGKPDIAIPTYSNEIGSYKNISSGYIPEFFYQQGNNFPYWNPTDIVSGNLDKDSLPDLVVTSGTSQINSNRVYIFKNTSNINGISFSVKTSVSTPSSPYSPIIDDFNSDGRPDIAVANFGTGNISLFSNNCTTCGVPSFSSNINFTTNAYPVNIKSKDLDGDNLPEIVVSYNTGTIISIFRNISTNSFINFAPKFDLNVNNGTYIPDFSLTDLNDDNMPDLEIIGFPNTLSIFQNSSSVANISFLPKVDYNTGNNPRGIGVGDIDGDAKLDIMISKQNVDTLSIFKNISTSTNTYLENKVDLTSEGIKGGKIFICDMNADGKADIISENYILRNKIGTPPILNYFSPTTIIPTDTLNIVGANLTGTTFITLGGIMPSYFKVINDTLIIAVASSVSIGNIVVNTAYGSATIGGLIVHTVPKINSIIPQRGTIGSVVQIKGAGFNNSVSGNTVFFGAVKATVLNANDSIINVIVPAGSTCENISLIVPDKKLGAYTNTPFTVTYPGAGASFTQSSFADKLDFACDTLHQELLQADLGSDGKPDLLIPFALFTPETDSTFASTDYFLSTYQNNSNLNQITFNNKVDHPAIYIPRSYNICDIDANGKLDVITGNGYDIAIISAYLNISTNNDIVFSPPKTIFRNSISGEQVKSSDLDRDGRIDLVESTGDAYAISYFRNISNNQGFNFGGLQVLNNVNGSFAISVGDIDGDQKPEIISSSYLKIYRNTSIPGIISFAPYISLTNIGSIFNISLFDIDNDNKLDILYTNPQSNCYSFLRNTSSVGNILFEQKVDSSFINPGILTYSDMDGDGKIDIVISKSGTDSVAVIKNLSTPGLIKFATPIYYKTGGKPASIILSDVDIDGKLDIVTLNNKINCCGTLKTFSILRNRIGEPQLTSLCSNSNTVLTSNISGLNYKWQLNNGSGYVDINNDINYNGASSSSLQIQNAPSNWIGNKYRCLVDGLYSYEFSLKFKNIWTGSVNNLWENPANWSCGTIPDANTDVIINSGAIIVNSNVTIRSLNIASNVNITISSGFNLTILNQ